MNTAKKLVDIFKNFPTVGPRTAGRFVYYLMKLPKSQIDELTNALQDLKNQIKFCQLCFSPHEGEACPICSDPRRDKKMLCIVEKEMDLEHIEKTKKFIGLYFILGAENLRLEELKHRAKNSQFSEIIIALNPTQEGRANSVLTERALKDINFQGKLTHLAQGIPAGGELEYADEETLESALSGRK